MFFRITHRRNTSGKIIVEVTDRCIFLGPKKASTHILSVLCGTRSGAPLPLEPPTLTGATTPRSSLRPSNALRLFLDTVNFLAIARVTVLIDTFACFPEATVFGHVTASSISSFAIVPCALVGGIHFTVTPVLLGRLPLFASEKRPRRSSPLDNTTMGR